MFCPLEETDRPVHMVEMFGPSEELLGIARQAMGIKAKKLWVQIAVYDDEAAAVAEATGPSVVIYRCPKIKLYRPFWRPRLDLGVLE